MCRIELLLPDDAVGLPSTCLAIGDEGAVVAPRHGVHNGRQRGVEELKRSSKGA